MKSKTSCVQKHNTVKHSLINGKENINLCTEINKNTIMVRVANARTKALIDTGASVTCITNSFLKTTGLKSTNLQVTDTKQIVGVSGNTVNTLGTINIPITIDGRTMYHHTIVLNNSQHSLIIGIDFLKKHKAQIHLDSNSLLLDEGNNVHLVDTNGSLARTKQTYTIKPKHEADIPVLLHRETEGKTIILEPLSVLPSMNLAGGRSLVAVNEQQAYFRVINPTNSPITIPQNKVVAIVNLVDIQTITPLNNTSTETHKVSSASQNTHCCNDSHNTLPTNNTSQENKSSLHFNLENSDLSMENKNRLQSFLLKNSDVFATDLSQLGKTHLYQHRIETHNACPVRQRAYRTSPEIRKEQDRQVEEMLENDIIEPSTSNWQSPVVMARKRNGEYRFAVDYRRLNKVTTPQFFPLPRFEDVLDTIGDNQAQIFSTLDLASGYWQIPLDPETAHKSAFVTHSGVYQWKRLPFGLVNSPASFQMIMSEALRSLNWKCILIYVDDILVLSKSFEEHMQHLDMVFNKLREANLTLKPSKCQFAVKEVQYLGYIITTDGVKTDPGKTKAVNSFPAPKNCQNVREFLGLCNFYRRFVKGFANIASPLTNLLKTDTNFTWTDECQHAFNSLKDALTSAPILMYPNMNKQFILTTDASGKAIGYILGQLDDQKRERVIAYGGRSLKSYERKWATTDLEMLAVAEGIKHFHVYLANCQFTIYTDHQALTCLKNAKYSSGKLARWAVLLEQYQFDIQHRPGKSNGNADALSRRDYNEEETNDEESLPDIPSPNSFVASANLDLTPQTDQTVTNDTGSTNKLFSIQSSDVNDSSLSSYNYISTIESSTTDLQDRSHVEVTLFYSTTSPEASIMAVDQALDQDEDAHEDRERQILHDISQAQQECPDFQQMYKYLENGTLPEDKNTRNRIISESNFYDIIDCVLYHYFQRRTRGVTKDDRWIKQLALPRVKREDALISYHDSMAGGAHLGTQRTLAAIKLKYYWPRMGQDITDYVRSCEACQRAKIPRNQVKTPLVPIPPDPPFHRWHIDILCSLPCTSEGYQYILLVVESFSHWCEAFPLKTQEASEIATTLYNEVFTRYGAPRRLISDRGQNFMSKIVAALCNIFQVTRHHTSSYHPQTNSVCERTNSTIAQCLRTYCSKNQLNWQTVLPSIMMAFRMSPSTQSTEMSPFQLLFGTEMNVPFDTNLIPTDSAPQNVRTHMENLKHTLQITQQIAKENIELTQQKTKTRYDTRTAEPQYQLGDKVLLRTMKTPKGLSPKLQDKYEGPFYIVTIGPNYSYKLRHYDTNKELKAPVNANRIKPYIPASDFRQTLRARVDNRKSPKTIPQDTLANTANTHSNTSTPTQNNTTNLPLNQPQKQQNGQPKPTQSKDIQYFPIERLLQMKYIKGVKHYLVKWEGDYPTSWEPESFITNAAKHEYHLNRSQQKKRKRIRNLKKRSV